MKAASTTERLRKLVNGNIEVDGKTIDLPGDLDIGLSEAGVSSTDIVALAKLVAQDFNVAITPDNCATHDNLLQVDFFMDSKAA